MDAGARTSWAHDHPSIGRSPLFAAIFEEIVPKIDGNLVIFQETLTFGVVSVTGIKDVEWAVVQSGFHVVDVILHFQLDTIALVVLAAFELLIAIFLGQSFECPLFAGHPRVLHAGEHARQIGLLVLLDELLGTDALHVDAGQRIRHVRPRQIERARVLTLHPHLAGLEFWSRPLFGVSNPFASPSTGER